MIQLLIALALCAALLLTGAFVRSLRPVTLSARITAGSSVIDSTRFRQKVLQSLIQKFTDAFASQKNAQQVLFELPDFLELLSVAISSGESIYSSLRRVVPRLNGVLADELRKMLLALELGSDLSGELHELSRRLPQRQVVEFCNKLSLALGRGTPLARVLSEQAESVRQEVMNQLTKQAGKNETRMLVPLVFLILPVTVLFAVYPSLKLLNIAYL
jgi:tight adherence protein C